LNLLKSFSKQIFSLMKATTKIITKG